MAGKYGLDWFKELVITASNDINEETILSLNEQGHKITAFGIGRFAPEEHQKYEKLVLQAPTLSPARDNQPWDASSSWSL